MKKIRILLLIIFLFPFSVLAEELITYDCPKDYKLNDTIECDLKVNTNYNLSAIDFEIDSNVEIKGFINNENWQGSMEKKRIMLYTDVNKTGLINIGKIKLKINKDDDIKFEFKNILYYDENFEEIDISKEKNVNNEKTKEQIEQESKNSKKNYVIIILIIAVFVLLVGCFALYKKRGVK